MDKLSVWMSRSSPWFSEPVLSTMYRLTERYKNEQRHLFGLYIGHLVEIWNQSRFWTKKPSSCCKCQVIKFSLLVVFTRSKIDKTSPNIIWPSSAWKPNVMEITNRHWVHSANSGIWYFSSPNICGWDIFIHGGNSHITVNTTDMVPGFNRSVLDCRINNSKVRKQGKVTSITDTLSC